MDLPNLLFTRLLEFIFKTTRIYILTYFRFAHKLCESYYSSIMLHACTSRQSLSWNAISVWVNFFEQIHEDKALQAIPKPCVSHANKYKLFSRHLQHSRSSIKQYIKQDKCSSNLTEFMIYTPSESTSESLAYGHRQ